MITEEQMSTFVGNEFDMNKLESAITWKLVYLSADDLKKYLTSMGRHLSARYG